MGKLYTCSECGKNKQERDMTWLPWGDTTVPVCRTCRSLMGGDSAKGLFQLLPNWYDGSGRK